MAPRAGAAAVKKSPAKKAAPAKTAAATKKTAARKAAPTKAAATRKRKAVDGVRMIEVNGLPCFVEDRGGPFLFGLTFRVGYADETLPTHGRTHLVEHLSLFDASTARLPMNGSVCASETTLMVRGDADETRAFTASVSRALRALPLDRVRAEANVLRTESASRTTSSLASVLIHRFGAQGYGLAWLPELGLVDPDPADVQAWADRWFVAGNVALWASGPVPDGLELDLAAGDLAPPPVPETLPWDLPGWYSDQGNVVGISYLVPRSDASMVAAQLLERRCHARLRMEQGSSYTVRAFTDNVGSGHTLGTIAADGLDEHMGSVRDGLLAELGRLATIAPEAKELAEVIRDQERMWADPEGAPGIAANYASNWLHGRRVRSHHEAVEDLRALTPDAISRAAQEILDAAITQVPHGTPVTDRRYTAIPSGSPAQVVGKAHPRTRVLEQRSAADQLVVGQVGVSYAPSPTERCTVLTKELVAAVHWTDGARTWWGRDGLRVFVHPDEWKDGKAIVAALDAMAPADLVVAMPSAAGSAYLEEVDRRVAGAPKRGLFARRKR